MFKINKLENDLNNLRQDFEIVVRRLDQVLSLKNELEALVSRVAVLPTPPRERWMRTAGPAVPFDVFEMPTQVVPVAALVEKRNSKKLAQLPPPPICQIARVVICMNGVESQYVFSYDADGKRLSYYCGWFHDVGMRVLEAYGDKAWEYSLPGGKEWDEVFLTASA